MNAEPVVKPVYISEFVFTNPVQTSDSPRHLSQLTPRDTRTAASLWQSMYTELHSERPNMEFLQTAFQKLSLRIEG